MELVGDIGGTNVRLALVDQGRLASQVSFLATSVSSLSHALGRYLDANGRPAISHAALGVAAPIEGDRVSSPNGPEWAFSQNAILREFGFGRLTVLNDFEAAAWGVPCLDDSDVALLGRAQPQESTKLLIGPGTGFGIATISCATDGWHVIPGETAMIFRNGSENGNIFDYVISRFKTSRVGGFLSGVGLSRLYDAVGAVECGQKSRAKLCPPEQIVQLAKEKHGPAQRAVALFVDTLGMTAGNLALGVMSVGGVYITGGVARGIADAGLFDEYRFRHAFELTDVPGMKRCSTILAGISTNHVRSDDLALRGLRDFIVRDQGQVIRQRARPMLGLKFS
jgi:glucokinase